MMPRLLRISLRPSRSQFFNRPLGLCLSASLVAALLGLAVFNHPRLLSPLVRLGVPLHSLESLPGLGDVVLAAEAPQMSVQELKRKFDRNDRDFLLVDVRTPEEYSIAHLPGAVLIPIDRIEAGPGIGAIRQQLGNRTLILYCYSGIRSNRAWRRLNQAGIAGINLNGGIAQWRKKIDPSLPKVLY